MSLRSLATNDVKAHLSAIPSFSQSLIANWCQVLSVAQAACPGNSSSNGPKSVQHQVPDTRLSHVRG